MNIALPEGNNDTKSEIMNVAIHSHEKIPLHLFSASPPPFLRLVAIFYQHTTLVLEDACGAEFIGQERKLHIAPPDVWIGRVHSQRTPGLLVPFPESFWAAVDAKRLRFRVDVARVDDHMESSPGTCGRVP